MTGNEFAHRLVDAGLDPAEALAKASLYDRAANALSDPRGASNAWWVPGRLELFGKHTDYAGGRTLVAAVPRGFVFASTPRTDDTIVVTDAGNGEQVCLAREGAALSGWRRYAAVVAGRLSRNFPGSSRGLTIAFASDLPRASGMSSSSALVVGIATALIERWELSSSETWQREIRSLGDLASYLACVENGATFGQLAGDAGVGTHGGSEDHVAMLLGLPSHFSAYAFAPLRHLRNVRLPSDWAVVVASSGVSAEKTGGAQAPYNHLAEGAGVLLRLWNESEAVCDSLGAVLASSRTAPDRLRELVDASAVTGFPVEHLQRRLRHFQEEDAAVLEAARALDEADGAAIGEISRQSQWNAEHLLRQQVPQTSALAKDAQTCGAYAACSFGAGFGGSVWALVERTTAQRFASEWLARYVRQHGAVRVAAFIATPGPAVTPIRVS